MWKLTIFNTIFKGVDNWMDELIMDVVVPKSDQGHWPDIELD